MGHQATPPEFNYKSTIKIPAPEKFSCVPTVEEEAEDY
jgi:hypothetical protein